MEDTPGGPPCVTPVEPPSVHRARRDSDDGGLVVCAGQFDDVAGVFRDGARDLGSDHQPDPRPAAVSRAFGRRRTSVVRLCGSVPERGIVPGRIDGTGPDHYRADGAVAGTGWHESKPVVRRGLRELLARTANRETVA